jgi:hypothetical protein
MQAQPSTRTTSGCTISVSAPAARRCRRAAQFLTSIGTGSSARRADSWAPAYYSMLFEDPDGIRLEINHAARGC